MKIQQAICINGSSGFNDMSMDLTYLNELLDDGWKVISLTPASVSAISTNGNNNAYASTLVYTSPILVILEK
jgi:hypothetical protein